MSMSMQEFMVQYHNKYRIWASAAAAADLSSLDELTVAMGWSAGERPSHALFNAWQNRADARADDCEARLAYLEYLLGLDSGGANAGAVLAPNVLTPFPGAVIPITGDLTITTDPLAVAGPADFRDVHASSDWKVCTDKFGAFVVLEAAASLDLTRHVFKGINLAGGREYFIFVRHNGVRLGVGPWRRVDVLGG